MSPPAFAQADVAARPASAFVDSVGVNTHLTSEWDDTAYGACANGGVGATPPCSPSVARIGAALRQIGVRHIRDGVPKPYVTARFKALAAAVPGLRLDDVVSDDRAGPLDAQLGSAAQIADLIEYIEGPNEPNNPIFKFHYHKHPFPTGAVEEMHDLRALLPGTVLAGTPIADVGLGGGTDADAGRLGTRTQADFANAHAYVGKVASRKFARTLSLAHDMAPGRPTLITETGHCTPTVLTDWCAVSEVVQAKYALTALADAFEIGVVRTYLYELVDERPDPGGADVEQHFGLFHVDWSPKPAGTALANLHAVVGGGGKPGSLGFSLAGARTVLLRRADGVYLIVAWFDADLWDVSHGVPLDVAARPFTLKLRDSPVSLAVFDPLDGSRKPLEAATTTTLTIPDHPVVIEVKPG